MSRNNWVEGEFQQIWEGWGVPVLFTGPLLSGGFCALAGAVLGARSRLRGSRLSAAMGPPRDRAGSWRHPERSVWGPTTHLLPWCGCVAASCWLSCPFPGLQQALQDGAAVLLLPGEWWPHPAPRCPAPGILLSRVPGVLRELRTALSCPVLAEQSWDGCRCCPRGSVLPPLPRVWLIRRQWGYSRAVPPWALFFFSLLSLLFNEPTLEDLERRSCSFSVTYLPASAPYSAEGINLCSRRGAERRARPAARRRLHNSRRGRGGLPGGGRGVDVEHSAPRLMAFPAWSRKKKVPLQQGTSW